MQVPFIISFKPTNTLFLMEFTWGQRPKIIPKFLSPTKIQLHYRLSNVEDVSH